MTEKQEKDILWQEVETLTYIYCHNCDTVDSEYADEWYAIDHFYNKGWRGTKSGRIYCPKCGKKRLKPRKPKNK